MLVRAPLSFIAAVLWSTVSAPPAEGQLYRLSGRLEDSASAAPLARMQVCINRAVAGGWYRCADSDTAGHWMLDSLRADADTLRLSCRRIRGLPLELAAVAVPKLPSARPVVVRVNPGGCDLRPERRMSGIFAGHWSSGFEESEFVPCANAGWYVISDTAGIADSRRSGWLELPRGARTPGYPRVWPTARLAAPQRQSPKVFIRFRGVVTGPGAHGHIHRLRRRPRRSIRQ